MADQAKSSGDWTAGLIAIFATLLLGGAAPIALFFLLYKPQTIKREEQVTREKNLKSELDIQLARQANLAGLQKEGEEVASKLGELEKQFADKTIQEAVKKIGAMLEANKLEMTPEAKLRRDTSAIRMSDTKDDFPGGLRALQISVTCYGRWKDLATFIASVESMKEFTVVFGDLRGEGDKNAGDKHTYNFDLWIMMRRDLDKIGR
ncbi:hypothetical protein EDM80_02795 [bacterium]|nr:MAG: hypothetical protein EDM80_02795 [bacterium]RIK62566.1 MAG: hypothetical protein DCC64_09750 [Planctomycetota bacterium]